MSGELVGNSIHSYLELFADEVATLEDTSVTLEIAESETSKALERIPMTLATPQESTRCRIAAAKANLSRLPPGR